MWDAIHRQKELQYASRAKSHIMRQKQIHHLRHIISELATRPPEVRAAKAVHELADYGCLTQIHVVRLRAPALRAEDHTKEINFYPANIGARWQAADRTHGTCWHAHPGWKPSIRRGVRAA
jgi:NTE family protein